MDTISNIKNNIDILEVIGRYAPIKKVGSSFKTAINPLRKEKTSSLHIYPDTQRYYDFGCGVGGDVLDFIKIIERLDTKEAISFLQGNTYQEPLQPKATKPIKKKDNTQLIANLERDAKRYLSNNRDVYSLIELEVNNNISQRVRLSKYLHKLFAYYLMPVDNISYAKYLFENIIGYDNYFNCPVIIIRDTSNRAVDIVRYRPYRDGYTDMPKYLYTKSSKKPTNSYLYPLQSQMEELISTKGYVVVGEGLKNALNAYILGVPFISIESTSSIKKELKEYLINLKDINFLGAFDGDKAGSRAYKEISSYLEIDNLFTFDSQKDFSDYIKENYARY